MFVLLVTYRAPLERIIQFGPTMAAGSVRSALAAARMELPPL